MPNQQSSLEAPQMKALMLAGVLFAITWQPAFAEQLAFPVGPK
jgi:hypothetical protein